MMSACAPINKAKVVMKKDGPGLCRCCLSEDGSFRDLAKKYVWMDKPEIYVDMLRECFNINLCQYSEGPLGVKNIICDVCVILLRDAFHFKKQVLTSEKKFTEIMRARREMKAKAFEDDPTIKPEDVNEAPEDSDDDFLDSISNDGFEEKIEPKEETAACTSSNDVECKVEFEETRDQMICLPSGEWKVTAEGIQRHNQNDSYAIQPAFTQKEDCTTSTNKTLVCDTCGKSFKRKAKLSEHQLTHSRTKSFVCDVCGKSFHTKNYMTRHMKDVHKDTKGAKQTACIICGVVVKDMKKHLLVHSSEKPFACHVCGKSYKRKACLTQHLLSHSETKPFPCDICPKTFVSKGILKDHSCIHSGAKPFSCDVCKKCFAQKSHMRRHIQYVHNSTKHFACHICGIALKEERTLRKHLLCHTTEAKPFSCQTCGKSFKVKEYLAQHMSYVHSGAKPVGCNVCGKTYKLKRYLTEHMSLVHGGARPFACHICEKTFKLKVVLNDHLLRHSKTRPYACHLCGKAYSGKSCLTKHLRRHNEIKVE